MFFPGLLILYNFPYYYLERKGLKGKNIAITGPMMSHGDVDARIHILL